MRPERSPTFSVSESLTSIAANQNAANILDPFLSLRRWPETSRCAGTRKERRIKLTWINPIWNAISHNGRFAIGRQTLQIKSVRLSGAQLIDKVQIVVYNEHQIGGVRSPRDHLQIYALPQPMRLLQQIAGRLQFGSRFEVLENCFL